MKKDTFIKNTYWGFVLLMGLICSTSCVNRGSSDYLNYDDGIRAQGSNQPTFDAKRGNPKPASIRAEDSDPLETEALEQNTESKGFFSFLRRGNSSNDDGSDAQSGELEAQAEVPVEAPVYRYRLKPGDSVLITIRGAPGVNPVEDVVDENGNIKMEFLDVVYAEGKTSAELEQYIHEAYISRKIFKDISVSVILPMKSYFIRGEILKPGRFPLLSGVSIVQAIAAAGGFSEFANPKKVSIIRKGRTVPVNVRDIENNRNDNIRIEEGDVIVVHRSFL